MRRYLLADDDVDDRDLFREALQHIDNEIIFYWAEDGKNAIDKLQQGEFKKPHLIFLDINMPNMNGWQCLKALKADERYNDIPVIMFSTSFLLREIEIASALGAVYFVTKPNNFTELKKLLNVIVNNLKNNLSGALQLFYNQNQG